jgi:hypothetical protein
VAVEPTSATGAICAVVALLLDFITWPVVLLLFMNLVFFGVRLQLI